MHHEKQGDTSMGGSRKAQSALCPAGKDLPVPHPCPSLRAPRPQRLLEVPPGSSNDKYNLEQLKALLPRRPPFTCWEPVTYISLTGEIKPKKQPRHKPRWPGSARGEELPDTSPRALTAITTQVIYSCGNNSKVRISNTKHQNKIILHLIIHVMLVPIPYFMHMFFTKMSLTT